MNGTPPTLPHLPFFERIAAVESGSEEFRAVSAGLVTLRLVDEWSRHGAELVGEHGWGLRAVREAVLAMDDGDSLRNLLLSVVDTLETEGPQGRMSLVMPRLAAYGRALQFNAAFELAADVYATILAHANPQHDAESLITAGNWRGACLRNLARWDEARESYEGARVLAEMHGDVIGVFRSHIGEAVTLMDRGNLPAAAAMYDGLIDRATELGLTELRAELFHDRAVTAIRRGHPEEGVEYLHRALRDARVERARDRMIADLAVCFFDLGLISAARDANLILAASAQEHFVRWQATMNLMEIAAVDQFEPVFEQYRRELATADMPPWLLAGYLLQAGHGLRRFGRTAEAREALERSLAVAQRNEMHQAEHLAEQSLADLNTDRPMERKAPADVTPVVSEAMKEVERLRELAGIRR